MPESVPAGFSLKKTTEACEALIQYVKDSAAKGAEDGSKKQDLLADFVDDDETTLLESIDLLISTKKYSRTEKSLKPCVLPLPHSIRPKKEPGALSICVFVKDPESSFEKLLVEATKTPEECLAALKAEASANGDKSEDVVDSDDTIDYAQKKSGKPSLQDLANNIRIDRVVSLSSLKGEFKPFQARRKLISEHDLFFAQDTIFDKLPGLLGKSFYKSSKSTPQIITMSRRTKQQVEEQKKIKLNILSKDSKNEITEVVSLTKTLQQIYTVYTGTSYILSAGLKLHMRVGSTALTAKENAENVISAVEDFVSQKKAVTSWKSVSGIYLKTPKGPSLPVYIDETPYEDAELDVVEDEDELIARKRDVEAAKQLEEKKRKRTDRSHIEQLLEEVVDEEDMAEFVEKRNQARVEARKEAKKAKLAAAAAAVEEKKAEEEPEEVEEPKEKKVKTGSTKKATKSKK